MTTLSNIAKFSLLFATLIFSLQSIGCGGPACGGQDHQYEEKWHTDDRVETLSEKEQQQRQAEADKAFEEWKAEKERNGWIYEGKKEENGKVFVKFRRDEKKQQSEGNVDKEEVASARQNLNAADETKQSNTDAEKGKKADDDESTSMTFQAPDYEPYVKGKLNGKGLPKSVDSIEKWKMFNTDSAVMVCHSPYASDDE